LLSHADTPIAEALLDQRNLAGIGNLYKAESLFVHGTWPWTPVRRVRDLPGLVTVAQKQMTANLGRWTQSTTGSLLAGEATFVYGRKGRSCRRCGTPIKCTDQDALGPHRAARQHRGAAKGELQGRRAHHLLVSLVSGGKALNHTPMTSPTSVRDDTPSLRRMFDTWMAAVLGEM
jgi:hypothetical protein